MTFPSPERTPPTSREEFAANLRDFINAELPRLHPKIKEKPQVDFTTPLFASGLIDSMAIIHLIAFVEQATGQPIPTQRVVMKHFQTIQAIADTFWPPAPPS